MYFSILGNTYIIGALCLYNKIIKEADTCLGMCCVAYDSVRVILKYVCLKNIEYSDFMYVPKRSVHINYGLPAYNER